MNINKLKSDLSHIHMSDDLRSRTLRQMDIALEAVKLRRKKIKMYTCAAAGAAAVLCIFAVGLNHSESDNITEGDYSQSEQTDALFDETAAAVSLHKPEAINHYLGEHGYRLYKEDGLYSIKSEKSPVYIELYETDADSFYICRDDTSQRNEIEINDRISFIDTDFNFAIDLEDITGDGIEDIIIYPSAPLVMNNEIYSAFCAVDGESLEKIKVSSSTITGLIDDITLTQQGFDYTAEDRKNGIISTFSYPFSDKSLMLNRKILTSFVNSNNSDGIISLKTKIPKETGWGNELQINVITDYAYSGGRLTVQPVEKVFCSDEWYLMAADFMHCLGSLYFDSSASEHELSDYISNPDETQRLAQAAKKDNYFKKLSEEERSICGFFIDENTVTAHSSQTHGKDIYYLDFDYMIQTSENIIKDQHATLIYKIDYDFTNYSLKIDRAYLYTDAENLSDDMHNIFEQLQIDRNAYSSPAEAEQQISGDIDAALEHVDDNILRMKTAVISEGKKKFRYDEIDGQSFFICDESDIRIIFNINDNKGFTISDGKHTAEFKEVFIPYALQIELCDISGDGYDDLIIINSPTTGTGPHYCRASIYSGKDLSEIPIDREQTDDIFLDMKLSKGNSDIEYIAQLGNQSYIFRRLDVVYDEEDFACVKNAVISDAFSNGRLSTSYLYPTKVYLYMVSASTELEYQNGKMVPVGDITITGDDLTSTVAKNILELYSAFTDSSHAYNISDHISDNTMIEYINNKIILSRSTDANMGAIVHDDMQDARTGTAPSGRSYILAKYGYTNTADDSQAVYMEFEQDSDGRFKLYRVFMFSDVSPFMRTDMEIIADMLGMDISQYSSPAEFAFSLPLPLYPDVTEMSARLAEMRNSPEYLCDISAIPSYDKTKRHISGKFSMKCIDAVIAECIFGQDKQYRLVLAGRDAYRDISAPDTVYVTDIDLLVYDMNDELIYSTNILYDSDKEKGGTFGFDINSLSFEFTESDSPPTAIRINDISRIICIKNITQ